MQLDGLRVVELGCGLGVPSLAASRSGAAVLATDADPEALDLLLTDAARNGVELNTARVSWSDPAELLAAAPFDLVLASDVLYQRVAVAQLLSLLPKLAPWFCWRIRAVRQRRLSSPKPNAFGRSRRKRGEWSASIRSEGMGMRCMVTEDLPGEAAARCARLSAGAR